MARVKYCRSCGTQNAPSSPFCAHCGEALADAEIVDTAVTLVEPAAQPPPQPSQPGRGTWRADAAPAVLVFPWGEVEVDDTLPVGRDPDFSPLGERIEREGFGWVSNKHAEVAVEDGRLHVRDMNSSNGTYVNGKRIDQRPVPLFDGDRIGFSRRLVATVRLTAR